MNRSRSIALAVAAITLLALEAGTLVAAAPQARRLAGKNPAFQTMTRVLGQTVPSALRSEIELAATSLIVSGVTRLSDMYSLIGTTAPESQCELARCPKAARAKAVPAASPRRHLIIVGEPI